MQLLFWFHLWAKFWMTLKCRAQTMCSFLGFHLWSSDAYGTALPMSSATTLNTGSSDSSQMSSFLLVVSFLLSPRVLVFHYFRLFFFLPPNATSKLFLPNISQTHTPLLCSQCYCCGSDCLHDNEWSVCLWFLQTARPPCMLLPLTSSLLFSSDVI